MPSRCHRNPRAGPIRFASKRSYVNRRLIGYSLEDLLSFVGKIADEYGDEGLEKYLTGFGVTGVDGELKNLIFAADGPKPRIVLRHAVNNVIEIVKNADHCLVYDRPLGPDGLTWQALVDWWRDHYEPVRRAIWKQADGSTCGSKARYRALPRNSCSRPTPSGTAKGTASISRRLSRRFYLHYDPYTKAELGPEGGVLARQRMDYLMLFPDQSRVVIEVDGRQHYSSGDKNQFSDPGRYAEMVREDRALRLRGYEVYRFGGAEFAEDDAAQRVNEFFEALLSRHGLQA